MLNANPVTAAERELLSKEIENSIVATISRLGFQSRSVGHAIESAAKMVSSRVNERVSHE